MGGGLRSCFISSMFSRFQPRSCLPMTMLGRSLALGFALCLSVLLGGAIARAQSVAFINPGKSDEVYWMTATQGMQAAARSLGMMFEVQYAQREPLKTFAIARELVARPPGQRPDYIVITDD